jgi:hypothetical protein
LDNTETRSRRPLPTIQKFAEDAELGRFPHHGLNSFGIALEFVGDQSGLAQAYAEVGQFEEGWQLSRSHQRGRNNKGNVVRGQYTANRRGSRADVAERDAVKAETYFRRALAVAREQHATSWELRVAMSMARLWNSQGRRQQARDLVSPVYGGFAEGLETLDLKDAKDATRRAGVITIHGHYRLVHAHVVQIVMLKANEQK